MPARRKHEKRPPVKTAREAAPQRPPVRLLYIAVALAAATFLLYLPTLNFARVIWDDVTNIEENPYLRPLTFANLREIWRRPYGELYVPMVYTSYALELAISGGNAWIHHLTNATLHAASAAIVFGLVYSLVGNLWPALAGAALFAFHPIQVEAVCWVTGRKDTLSGFFAFAAIALYVRARGRWSSSSAAAMNWPLYGLALISFVLALLSKPAAVAVPLMLVVLDLFAFRINWKRAAAAWAPWFLIGGIFAVVTAGAQPISRAVPLWMRPFVAAEALLFYITKLIAPIGLAPIYAHSPFEIGGSWLLYVSLPVIIAALWFAWRAGGGIRLGALLFVAGVAPVLGLKQFRYQNYSTVADRYLYLSMLGAAVLVADALRRAAERWLGKTRMLQVAAAASLLVFCGFTLRQQRFWSTSERLVRRMMQIAPDSGPARSMLAVIYMKEGRIDDVIRENREALRLLQHPFSYQNLAYSLLKKAESISSNTVERRAMFAEALAHYQKAVQMEPKMGDAWEGMGRVYMNVGDIKSAIPAFEKAVQYVQGKPGPFVNLGLCYMREKQYAKAIPPLQRAVQISPKAEIMVYLAEAYINTGQLQQADAVLATAERLEPQNPDVKRARARLNKQMQNPRR